VSWRSAHDFIEEGLSLNVKLDFNVTIGQKPHILMACSYVLEYGLDSMPPSEGRDALLSAFAKVNGVYNAWPYLRENLHTTCARMSVPPPLLPIYRVVPPSGKGPKSGVPETDYGLRPVGSDT
jgi:hypothetical protein